MGVARTVYMRRAVFRVLSSSSLHATSCILFGISTSSPFPPFPPFPPYLHIGDPRLAQPVPVRHVHLTLSVLVRYVRPTLSISLTDISVRCSLSDVVRSSPTCLSDAVRLSVRHVHLTLSVFVSRSCSRSCSCFHSLPVPIPVPVPIPPLRFHSHSCLRHQNSLESLGEPPPLHFFAKLLLILGVFELICSFLERVVLL